jgi:hypothetical protein
LICLENLPHDYSLQGIFCQGICPGPLDGDE